MDDADNIIPLRRIPVLTQAEIESVRTPGDIMRIVEARPDREYQIIRGSSENPAEKTLESPEQRNRRHSASLQAITLGAAGYAFGISSASCIAHLTSVSAILATLSALALFGSGCWVYRTR
jgi:hypothetical protein